MGIFSTLFLEKAAEEGKERIDRDLDKFVAFVGFYSLPKAGGAGFPEKQESLGITRTSWLEALVTHIFR